MRALKSGGITLSPRAAIGGSVVGEGRLTTRLRVSIGRGATGIKFDKKLDILANDLKKIYRGRKVKLGWKLQKNFEGLKFKRQYPIGKYLVDFVYFEKTSS